MEAARDESQVNLFQQWEGYSLSTQAKCDDFEARLEESDEKVVELQIN